MWLTLTTLWTPVFAGEPEPPTCEPAGELVSETRWLRAASLDLRGRIPTPAELDGSQDPVTLIDAWLNDEAFVHQAVRDHQTRLWNRVENVSFGGGSRELGATGGIWWARQRSDEYRGERNLFCGDRPAADEDGDGVWDLDANGGEGWVEVSPYWAPDTTIQVCAFDASDRLTSNEGIACADRAANNSNECGCGPDLQYCTTRAVQDTLRDSIGLAMDERIAAVVREGRPYTDLYLEDLQYLNGPLTHFYRHQLGDFNGSRFDGTAFPLEALPDLTYLDTDTWVAVPTHAQNAGIFTDPAFLLRFMTNRARVDRFYSDFLCAPLTAPNGGIDLSGDITLDLSARPGCLGCHAIIEPSAVYWGRHLEGSASFLDPELNPAFSPSCYQCTEDDERCSGDCISGYTVDPREAELYPYVGYLKALQFRDPDEHSHIDDGPGALVEARIASGDVSSCLTSKTTQWLLGREPGPSDAQLLGDAEAALLSTNWSYRELVRAVVISDSYRRAK